MCAWGWRMKKLKCMTCELLSHSFEVTPPFVFQVIFLSYINKKTPQTMLFLRLLLVRMKNVLRYHHPFKTWRRPLFFNLIRLNQQRKFIVGENSSLSRVFWGGEFKEKYFVFTKWFWLDDKHWWNFCTFGMVVFSLRYKSVNEDDEREKTDGRKEKDVWCELRAYFWKRGESHMSVLEFWSRKLQLTDS